MKRRTIGAAGALALTASLVLATGPAFADEPRLGVDETYDFTSATHLSYIQHYRDSSKTLITEQTCSYISSTNSDLKTKFHTEGSVNVCDVITEVNETDINEFLEVSGNNFTFTSESDVVLKSLSKEFPNDKFDSIGKVTAKFAGGLVPSSADNGGTIDKSTGTVTWSNVKINVKVKGSTDGKAAASSSASSTTKSSSTAKSGSTSSASADSDSTSEASSTPDSTSSSSSSGSKWILLLVLAVIVIGGIGAFVVMSNRKKAQTQGGQYPQGQFPGQPMGGQYPAPGQYPQAPQPGQYPAPTGQPQPGQYPEQGQYPQTTQYPQAPQQPGQYPEQGQQPGQYPQA